MRVHRLIRILMKLDQEGKVKAHDMAEALEVSCRTIYRDIDILCEAGYPIITTTGQKGGITFVEGYKLNLDQSDAALKTLITHLYAMPDQEKLVNAIESGLNLKYMSKDKASDENKQKILIDQKSWWEEDTTEIDLQPIMKALFLQHKLNIQYIQSDGSQSNRVIAPYGLVLKYTSWYVVAYCYMRNEIRTFNCGRVKHIDLLQESYTIPDDFVLKNYWTLSVKSFKKSRNEEEYYPVEIMVPKRFGSIFANYDIIGIKKEGDSIIGMIDLHKKECAQEDIRALLCYGQILYPDEMRLRANEILESRIQAYHKL
jgi:predicted DNA-binding transcriptional regulator YafY